MSDSIKVALLTGFCLGLAIGVLLIQHLDKMACP